MLTAYVLQNECNGLVKNDLNMQKGEEKETYHTFKMTKRGYASFVVASLVEDGGNTSYKIQKNEKGKNGLPSEEQSHLEQRAKTKHRYSSGLWTF